MFIKIAVDYNLPRLTYTKPRGMRIIEYGTKIHRIIFVYQLCPVIYLDLFCKRLFMDYNTNFKNGFILLI